MNPVTVYSHNILSMTDKVSTLDEQRRTRVSAVKVMPVAEDVDLTFASTKRF